MSNTQNPASPDMEDKVLNGRVLNDDHVKNFIRLLENLLTFELSIQKTLRAQYTCLGDDKADEVAFIEYEACFKPYLDEVRDNINLKLNDHMHNAIMDIVLQ